MAIDVQQEQVDVIFKHGVNFLASIAPDCPLLKVFEALDALDYDKYRIYAIMETLDRHGIQLSLKGDQP